MTVKTVVSGFRSIPIVTLFSALLLSPSLMANESESPVAFVPKSERGLHPIQKFILETEEGYIYRLPGQTSEDFEDLYYINLSDSLYDRLSIERLGQVSLMSEGRFAVLKIAEENVPEISAILHEERINCGQLIRLDGHETSVERSRAVAVPVIPISSKIEALAEIQNQVTPEGIERLVDKMSSLTTRYAKSTIARQTTDLLVNEYSQFGREDVTVSTFAHKSAPNQPSVIVRIEGKTRPEEVIVLGSHIDSIATFSSTAPGADDNASGTSSHFEVFRVIMENNLTFDRTIEIHGYAAEELGLVGSQEIARKYKSTGVKVIAMLQNDMNMYRAGTKDIIWLITNNTDTRLTADVAALVGQYQTVDLSQGRLTAGSSDHYAWTQQGFPSVFPTENPNAFNKKIHTSGDTIANSGKFTQSAEFSKLTLSFLAHFAGLTEAAPL